MITRLNHVAIRTANTIVMRNFYTRILGMIIDLRRPDHYDGFHLRTNVPAGEPIVHVMSGRDAEVAPTNHVPVESGAIHHMALHCQGFLRMREVLTEHGLPWREYRIPEGGLWQIFVFDPHGILLELTFESTVEGIADPGIPPGPRFDPRDRSWYDPALYRQFDEQPAMA